MKIRFVAFLAVASSKFAFVKTQPPKEAKRKKRQMIRKDNEMRLSKLAVIYNEPQHQGMSRSRRLSSRTGKADVGILSNAARNSYSQDANRMLLEQFQERKAGATRSLAYTLYQCESPDDDACHGAGYYGDFEAGNASCIGIQSCHEAAYNGYFRADNFSCSESKACYGAGYDLGAHFTVGNYACVGTESCTMAAYFGFFEAGNATCDGFQACFEAAYNGQFRANNGTCDGDHSCSQAAFGEGNEFEAADGACIGEYACAKGAYGGTRAIFNAGHDSCVGQEACSHAAAYNGHFVTGNTSCSGDWACSRVAYTGTFHAGDWSCQNSSACTNAAFSYGEFLAGHRTCTGYRACEDAGYSGTFVAGDRSCYGNAACARVGHQQSSSFMVGEGSCVGLNACYRLAYSSIVSIGNASCADEYACTPKYGDETLVIGHNSCGCPHCCQNLISGSQIGDCQCNSIDDGCSNATDAVIKLGSCPTDPPTSTPSSSSQPSGLPSSRPSLGPSAAPSVIPSVAPSAFVSPYQNLTFDKSDNLLGLTDSDVTVSLAHLVNDDHNELQDLVFNNETNHLSLTNSMSTVDLSHLDNPPQQLEFDEQTSQLGLTDSERKVDLSSLTQDLSMNGNTVEISAGGTGVDLSYLRVVALPASIENIDGDATTTRRRMNHVHSHKRRLKSAKDQDPIVAYGGAVTTGWAVVSPGRLVGMSIAAKCGLKTGSVEIGIVDCTNTESVHSMGSLRDVVNLRPGQGRSHIKNFATPIPVKAGAILCFEVIRFGKVDSEDGCDDNAASLLLMLEQW